MKRIISLFLIIISIFSLSACGKKEEPLPPPVEKGPTPPFTEINKNIIETIQIADPFPDDILLDRFENTLYYFNHDIGFYTTDPDGKEKERIKVFDTKSGIFFSTPNRINRVSEYGDDFTNIITRDPMEKIEFKFMSSDWMYYEVKDIYGQTKYYKLNLDGTSKEIRRIEFVNKNIPKYSPDYYYPQREDSKTIPYEPTYRSRLNNFSITFPQFWDGSYEIIDEKDLLIVKFKSRLDETLSYEFFRIKKMETEHDWIPEIENTNRYFFNRNGKYIIGRYKDEILETNLEYALIQQMEKYIPEIIYSLED